MIEVCPRCSSRLGAPLRSGRRVCANCGWADIPVDSKASLSQAPKGSSLAEILALAGRILRRWFAYVSQRLTSQWYALRNSAPRPQGKRLVEGLSDRLSALEKAIPSDDDGPRWMTVEDAFRYLGGDPKDSDSVVTAVNGSFSLPLRRFKLLKTKSEFEAFGLEADFTRREANKPWLRWVDLP